MGTSYNIGRWSNVLIQFSTNMNESRPFSLVVPKFKFIEGESTAFRVVLYKFDHCPELGSLLDKLAIEVLPLNTAHCFVELYTTEIEVYSKKHRGVAIRRRFKKRHLIRATYSRSTDCGETKSIR